ncbi:MAG: DUF4177 domain-containing protein [Paracoccaceae bacterium]
MRYEYKVIPAPTRGLKAKGVRSVEDRFAHALQTAMNTLGAEGWEYQRSDSLPCETREGLMGKTTVVQSMLVFRRTRDLETALVPALVTQAPDPEPALIENRRDSAETEGGGTP